MQYYGRLSHTENPVSLTMVPLPGNIYPVRLGPDTRFTPVHQNPWLSWISPVPLMPMTPARQDIPLTYSTQAPSVWRRRRKRKIMKRFDPIKLPKTENRLNDRPAGSKPKKNKVRSIEVTKESVVKIEQTNEENSECKTIKTKKKKKEKPSSKMNSTKSWNRQDAERALKVEMESKINNVKSLILRFPDPELSRDLIKSYHSSIEKVNFMISCKPRFCVVQLSENSNVDQVMNDLKQVDFYNLGKIEVEEKLEKEEKWSPESIDPYTLYVGNLPFTVDPKAVKQKFPTASKIDVGYGQKMKYTRYAFIRYKTVEESIEAFKSCVGTMFETRNLIVRFRRHSVKDTLAIKLGSRDILREKKRQLNDKLYKEELQRIIAEKVKTEKDTDEDEKPSFGSETECSEECDDSEKEEKEVDDRDVDEEDDDECDSSFMDSWKVDEGGEESDDDFDFDEDDWKNIGFSKENE